MCVCVFVWMRRRKRGREKECVREIWLCVNVLLYIYAEFERHLCNHFCYPVPPPPSCFWKELRAFKDRWLKMTISIIIIMIMIKHKNLIGWKLCVCVSLSVSVSLSLCVHVCMSVFSFVFCAKKKKKKCRHGFNFMLKCVFKDLRVFISFDLYGTCLLKLLCCIQNFNILVKKV